LNGRTAILYDCAEMHRNENSKGINIKIDFFMISIFTNEAQIPCQKY